MDRILLKSEIHRASVTDADLHYEGSALLGSALLGSALLGSALLGSADTVIASRSGDPP